MKTENQMYMENVRDIAVDTSNLIECKLKKFDITLTDEQEDAIHNRVWEVLESVSNGEYRTHM